MNVSSNGYLRVMQHRRQRDPIRLAQAVSTATMEIRTDPGTLIDYRGTAPADAITAGVSHSLTENDLSKDSDEIKELNADATGAEEVLDAIRVGAGVPEVMRALAQSDRWADDLEEHHVHRIGEAALFFVDIRSASVQASGVQVQGGGPLLSERQWYGLSTTMLSPSLKALVLVSEVPYVAVVCVCVLLSRQCKRRQRETTTHAHTLLPSSPPPVASSPTRTASCSSRREMRSSPTCWILSLRSQHNPRQVRRFTNLHACGPSTHSRWSGCS